jgi:hypothetical protein
MVRLVVAELAFNVQRLTFSVQRFGRERRLSSGAFEQPLLPRRSNTGGTPGWKPVLLWASAGSIGPVKSGIDPALE